jgi:hypothetical protein
MTETEETKDERSDDKLIEGRDFYFENGLFVLTEYFLLKRGFCCENGCRHCPYGYFPWKTGNNY